MRFVRGLIAGGLLAACASSYGTTDPPTDRPVPADADAAVTDSGDDPPVEGGPQLPKCGAQRTVHIVGGQGGLAWFTLLWPVPWIIEHPDPAYAYDDTTKAAAVAAGPHPLYERQIAGKALFDGTGTNPHPTAFVAGVNETHTNTPRSLVRSTTVEIIAAGALAQQIALAPAVPALGIGTHYLYGPTTNAPAILEGDDVAAAVSAIAAKANLSEADKASLVPDESVVSKWAGPEASSLFSELARRLLLAANAFRLGLVGTVTFDALGNDPHGAFADGSAAANADSLALIMRSFYAELAKHQESKCGHGDGPLSLADNVIVIVSGDTPKNSFQKSSWADGTTDNSNIIYARSNGWLQPGWFGALSPTMGRQNFDPVTGALSGTDATTSTQSAQTAILYAITRGDHLFTESMSMSPFSGVLASLPP